VFVTEDSVEALERRVIEHMRPVRPLSVEAGAVDHAMELVRQAVSLGARVAVGGARTMDGMEPTVLADVPPNARILGEDPFAPLFSIVPVRDVDHALALDADCPYALGAVVFGPERVARRLAGRIDAGVVVVNDVIVPTADPRVPFGGRRRSGFGTTRGLEGLLEMTRPKAVVVRAGRARPHFDPSTGAEEALFREWIRMAHGRSWTRRLAALPGWIRALYETARVSRERRARRTRT
jgi:acyl-CoA reductase-like NAD-dependent aldehyde dehydrogenase